MSREQPPTCSLYLHIPYCKQACHYCDFHFSTSLQTREAVLEQMHHELRTRAAQAPWQERTVQSIYFGGGTPSLLNPSEIGALLRTISVSFRLSAQLEITLEANPDDMDLVRLLAWRKLGINRLSVGIQSFHDSELRAMNRAHDASMAMNSLQHAQQAGFDNISVDLIYGMPNSSAETWQYNLDRVAAANVAHLSAYALTVEKKTALHHQLNKGMVVLPEDEEVVGQFHQLRRWAAEQSLEHYELSNFARSGRTSLHNSSYWEGVPYLGIGPGAHSFDGSTRRWNLSNNVLYSRGQPGEEEQIDPISALNEQLMVRLRTAKGFLWEEHMPDGVPSAALEALEREVTRAVALRLLERTPKGFYIQPELWMRSDAIIADLFVVDTTRE